MRASGDRGRYKLLDLEDGDAFEPCKSDTVHLAGRAKTKASRSASVLGAAAMLLLCCTFAWLAVSAWAEVPRWTNWTTPPVLRFTSDGTFQIAVFADLHFGENAWNQWGPQQDINTQRIMGDILDFETQQLCVLNGDLITGENQYQFNGSENLDRVVKQVVAKNLPFASTYGNHDSSFNLSRESILARERRYPQSLTKSMVPGRQAGVSNYYLEVFPHDGGSVPALLLWFFDSRGGFYYQEQTVEGELVGQPNWVDQCVVDWFLQTNDELVTKYSKVIPSLGFVHIPTNASAALQSEVGVDQYREPGINDDYILAPQAQGWCSNNTEGCPYGGQDEPFMQAIVSTPGLMALFSGHDHGDTWCYKWDRLVSGMNVTGNGINLCFNQHSGYGGYGNWTRGARQVLVREEELNDCSIETWIRLETGDVVGAVTLNNTYGKDLYPATPDTRTSCPTCDYSVVSPMPGTASEKSMG